jgi:hypothetical protein
MDQANSRETLFLQQLQKYVLDFGYFVDEREYENLHLHLYSTDSRYYELYYIGQNLVNICEIELEEISRNYSETIYTALKLFHRKEMIFN